MPQCSTSIPPNTCEEPLQSDTGCLHKCCTIACIDDVLLRFYASTPTLLRGVAPGIINSMFVNEFGGRATRSATVQSVPDDERTKQGTKKRQIRP